MPKTSSKKKSAQKTGIIIGAALLLVAVIVAGFLIFGKSEDKAKDKDKETSVPTTASQVTTQVQTTQAEPVLINPLTGLDTLDNDAVGKRPIAVVVENSPDARPQWGLCSPDIVIEGVVEGGISRMLWLYADVNAIPKVGPVRSARHDFVEMAEGLDAIFVHWGWSTIAESAIANRNVDNINGLNGSYFFRDTSRNVGSEHTGYTNGESIAKAISNKKYDTQINTTYAEPFEFAQTGSPTTPSSGSCQTISFAFSSSYKHTFKYDDGDNLYYNYMNSSPMVEDGGKQMTVSNVFILYCPVTIVDAIKHRDMDLTGGKGVFASNGAYENITWKKSNTPDAMLKLYAADGSELVLNTGKSYIAFVPSTQLSSTAIAGE